MTNVFQDLYQFSTYIQPINLTFHQYLLQSDEPLLVHTGNVQQAVELVPQLKEQLNGKTLRYIFISHFEADECGGLAHLIAHFPQAKPVCSEVTARQLGGFGLTSEAIIKKPGEKLNSKDYTLEFLSYPSEMHLWEGLLVFESKRGIFFSSDLMLRFGQAVGSVVESKWQTEIDSIRHEQIPDPERKAQLQKALTELKPQFAATGHGPCLRF